MKKKKKKEIQLPEYEIDRQAGTGLGITPEEAVYRSVVDCVKDNTIEVLELKMSKLRAIIPYKDSKELFEQCEKKLDAVHRKMVWKKVGKVLSWVVDILLVALVAFIIVWVIRRR